MFTLIGGGIITLMILLLLGTRFDRGRLVHLSGLEKVRARIALGVLGKDLYPRF